MYDTPVDPDTGALYSVKTFRKYVREGWFIDDDGFGHPVRDGRMDRSVTIRPSQVHSMPADATHVLWYNR